MTRPLLPHRDTMRVLVLLTAAKWIGALIIVGACFIVPDALVTWVMSR